MPVPGQSMLTPESGQFFTNQTLSRQLRAVSQPMTRFRQLSRKDGQFGKRSGQKLLFDKLLNLNASVKNGSIVPEGHPIPRDGFEIRQGECKAQTSGHGIPWTEEFQVTSEFGTDEPIESRALDHMAKSIDVRASKPFINDAKFIYTPTVVGSPSSQYAQENYGFAMNFTGTNGTEATRPLRVWDFRNVADMFKNGRYRAAHNSATFAKTIAPGPTWDGQSFLAIVSVEACRALKEDPKWEEAQYYGDPEKLFTGEAGRLYGIRFIEENHILRAFDRSGGWDTTYTDPAGEAVMVAKDPSMECVVTAEEIRIDLPTNFGLHQAMAWHYMGGWAPTWDGENEPDCRIVLLSGSNFIDHLV